MVLFGRLLAGAVKAMFRDAARACADPDDLHDGNLVDPRPAGDARLLPWRRAVVERAAGDTLRLVPGEARP